MKAKNSIESLALDSKTVFVRADLNVPVKEGVISDETRIQASLATVEHLLDRNCTVVLSSHLGRPKGEAKAEFSLEPVANRLKELISAPVYFCSDCVGEVATKMVKEHQGEKCVILLENLRFHKQEEKNDPDFSSQLASLAEFYINDAFGTAHRAHASTHGITKHLPSAPGFLLQKEIDYLGSIFTSPKRPLITILGGSKVSTKLSVLKSLLKASDKVLLGGGMVFTFYKAQGLGIGNSLCEEDFVEEAKAILEEYSDKLLLPSDVRVTSKIEAGAGSEVVSCQSIPDGQMGVDIGPATEAAYSEVLKDASTVLWNGPMGIFEIEDFAQGTKSICVALAKLEAQTIVGGGDSVAAVNQMGYQDSMSHISTGGGASLEFLEGKELPGVAALL